MHKRSSKLALGSLAFGAWLSSCGSDRAASTSDNSVGSVRRPESIAVGVDAAPASNAGASADPIPAEPAAVELGDAGASAPLDAGASAPLDAGASAPPDAGASAPPDAGAPPSSGQTPPPPLEQCSKRVPLSGGALHQATLTVFNRTCTHTPCHSTNRKSADVDLSMGSNLRALVDRAACVAPALKVVDGRGGDAALANSWLWLKLTAPFDTNGNVQANAAWGPPGMCTQPEGTYGAHMPFGASELLPESELDTIRSWICTGAPGP